MLAQWNIYFRAPNRGIHQYYYLAKQSKTKQNYLIYFNKNIHCDKSQNSLISAQHKLLREIIV